MSRSYTYKQINFNQTINDLIGQINKKNDNLLYYIYKQYVLKNYKELEKKNTTETMNREFKFNVQNYSSFKSFVSHKIRHD